MQSNISDDSVNTAVIEDTPSLVVTAHLVIKKK